MSSRDNEDERIAFNGINGTNGDYLFAEVLPKHISKVAKGEKLDAQDLAQIQHHHEVVTAEYFGVDGDAEVARDVTKAGWGIVVAEKTENVQEIIKALSPLLEYRKQQVGDKLYKQMSFKGGKDNIPSNWLARPPHKTAVGTVVPEKVPYYLLLVGSPEDIPFSFQFTLDVQYAVGRIYFDTVEEYAAYAKQVVDNETRTEQHTKKAVLFGVKNDLDKATEYSTKYLITPLLNKLESEHSDWIINSIQNKEATKENLKTLLHAPEKPAFVLTASHGMGFELEDTRQRTDQGALLCSDWPGQMKWNQPIPNDFYFAASDIAEDAHLNGMILFLFACYSGATPKIDHFNFAATKNREEIAPESFISALPQRLLTAGASAIIVHVDRAWASSFLGKLKVDNTPTFKGVIDGIFAGGHIGYAMEHINDYYSAQESEMSAIQDGFERSPFFDLSDREIANTYVSKNDARNYMILGDPAVKLSV